jgi:hypothetical protein
MKTEQRKLLNSKGKNAFRRAEKENYQKPPDHSSACLTLTKALQKTPDNKNY